MWTELLSIKKVVFLLIVHFIYDRVTLNYQICYAKTAVVCLSELMGKMGGRIRYGLWT